MQTVYTNSMSIAPGDDGPAKTLEAAIAIVHDWLQWSLRKSDKDARIEPSNGSLSLMGGAITAQTQHQPGKDAEVWTMTYQHPDQEQEGAMWRIFVRLSRCDERLAVDVDVRAGNPAGAIDSRRFIVVRPAFVKTLASRMDLRRGTVRVSTLHRVINAKEIQKFHAEVIMAKERRIPVIIVSAWGSGSRSVEPEFLADRLAGLAETYTFADRDVERAYNQAVPASQRCFNGAVRVIWPLEGTGAPAALWYSRSILESYRRGRWLPEYTIARDVIDHVSRFPADSPVYREALARQLAALGAMVAKGQKASDLAKALTETREMLEGRETYIQHLETENSELRRQLRASALARPAPESDLQERTPADCSNLAEVLDLAAESFDRLDVWESAYEGAADSTSEHFRSVYPAMRAIHELAEATADGQRTGNGLGMSIHDFFVARGIEWGDKLPEYTKSESTSTMSKYGNQRQFSNGSLKRKIEQHFTLGNGSREECIQIYFEIEPEAGRAIVGYCGRHLEYWGQKT